MQPPQRLARFNRHVTKAEAAPHISAGSRRIFARLPFEQAVLLTKTD